jgi:probable rRNA maturation factor
MAIVIQNNSSIKNDNIREIIIEAAEKTLEARGISKDDVEISVVVMDNDGIQELNKKYRGLDCPTDVLSFPMYEHTVQILDAIKEFREVLLGDVIISLEKAGEQAEEYGHSVEREISFLVVHGVLHLLGFDHKEEEQRKIMRQEEDKILNMLNM